MKTAAAARAETSSFGSATAGLKKPCRGLLTKDIPGNCGIGTHLHYLCTVLFKEAVLKTLNLKAIYLYRQRFYTY
jgi:hypothetical protein